MPPKPAAHVEGKPAVNINVTRKFYASDEEVFDAWFDTDTAGEWLFATKTGQMLRVEIDPRVGGEFVIVERREREEVEHRGKYLERKRPARISFEFSVPKFSAEVTRVTIDIVPLDDGCELTLTHEGVYPEYEEQTRAGWEMILDGLAETLNK